MRFSLAPLLAFALMAASHAEMTAAEERPIRKALIIANQAYAPAVGRLTYPSKDAALLKPVLERHGFDVTIVADADLGAMRAALQAFQTALSLKGPDAVGFFHYSGHGAADAKTNFNYLIPVDAIDPRSRKLWDASLSLVELRNYLSVDGAALIISIDACRDLLTLDRSLGGRAFYAQDFWRGTLLAFSTQFGKTAIDGDAETGASPYAAALAEELSRVADGRSAGGPRKIEASELFKRVRLNTAQRTGDRQTPMFDDLGPIFFFEPQRNERGWEPKGKPQTLKDCDDCPTMVKITGRAFLMGSPEDELAREPDEGPTKRVEVDDFWLAETETTVGLYRRFIGETGRRVSGCHTDAGGGRRLLVDEASWSQPGFEQTEDHPVACVSFRDAEAFVRWLNGKVDGAPYRLPSEAEFEYAHRAGSEAAYPWGDDRDLACQFANTGDAANRSRYPEQAATNGWRPAACSDGHAYTAPTTAFGPNKWGLYGLAGNVWEWTADCYAGSLGGVPTDGSPASTTPCARRVLKGGTWAYEPELSRSAARIPGNADWRYFDFGFRVARD